MNTTKKKWFCYGCSLQCDSRHVYYLHLKLVHKHIIGPKSSKKDHKSNESLSSDEKSDQNEKKTFECKICQYCFSQRSKLNFHISLVHEGKSLFKCEFCNYSCSSKRNFDKHVASVHEGKKAFKCEFCNQGLS